MVKAKSHAHFAVFFINIFFGINLNVSKTLLANYVGPLGLSLMRATFACVGFWLVSMFMEDEKVTKKDLLLLVAASFFGMILNQLTFVFGLSLTSPIDASIIATSTPIIVMLISTFILKDSLTLIKLAGVLIGASGAVMLILTGHHAISGGSSNIWGNILCLVSCFSYAIYLLITKPISQRYKSITIMKWMFLYSSLIMIPIGYREFVIADIIHIPENGLWMLGFTLLFGTFIPYMLIPMSLKLLTPTTMSMYNYLQPVVATVLAIILLQDSFTWHKAVAASMVFIGVYLVNKVKLK